MIARYSTMSGVLSVRLLNSWLMCILPSNCGNCFAMNSLAIGVDEPHSTLSTRPCEIAACSSAGAESGVKSMITPPPSPAACTSCSTVELASVIGSLIGNTLLGMPAASATLTTPPSA